MTPATHGRHGGGQNHVFGNREDVADRIDQQAHVSRPHTWATTTTEEPSGRPAPAEAREKVDDRQDCAAKIDHAEQVGGACGKGVDGAHPPISRTDMMSRANR